jgi:hypothetical protein
MTIPQIEQEFGGSLEDIISDFQKEDYMGCRAGINDLASMFGMGRNTLKYKAKKRGINLDNTCNKHSFVPTLAEDAVWVKYGITLKQYLRTRYNWLTWEEMAYDLNVSKDALKVFASRKLKRVDPVIYRVAKHRPRCATYRSWYVPETHFERLEDIVMGILE